MNEVSVRKQGSSVSNKNKSNRLNDTQKLIIASESTQWYLKNSFDTGWKGWGTDTYNNMNKKDKEKVKNVIPTIGNLIYKEFDKKGGTPTIDEFMGSYNKFIGEYKSMSESSIGAFYTKYPSFEKFGVNHDTDNIFLMKYMYYRINKDKESADNFLKALGVRLKK